MLKFIPNKLGFNSAGCMTSIMKTADAYMSLASQRLIEIMKRYIGMAGNGSSVMRSDAQSVVREILHEVTEDHINIEAGFDEDMARGMAVDFFVRVMVVIYGNQAGGSITSKPGMSTFKKHVVGPSPSTAKTEYDLSQFNQFDVSGAILDNTMKDIKVVFEDILDGLDSMFTGDFFGAFITGG